MKIRQVDLESDQEELRKCVIELQDFEKQIDPRMPSGDGIADAYLEEMVRKTDECAGRILVAVDNNIIAGYATVLARVTNDDLDDGGLEYAVINDLMVKEPYRGQGTGKMLIAAAEQFAKSSGARWLRLSVLASNQVARSLYISLGFSELCVDLEKDLGARS